MSRIFGSTWASQYGDDSQSANGREWAMALRGLSREDIDRACDWCRDVGGSFPPAMGEFRALAMGIPSLVEVTRDLHPDSNHRSAFSSMVAAGMDMHRFRTVTADAADRMLRAAYDEARRRRLTGEPLPEIINTALDNRPADPIPASPEVRDRYLAEIAADLGVQL